MNKALEKTIEELKQQALDKDLFTKSTIIAQYLGVPQERRDSHHYDMYNFFTSLFDIKNCVNTSPPERNSVCVKHNEKLVFEGSLGNLGKEYKSTYVRIEAYIHGDWEIKFESIYVEAQKAKENIEKKKREEERREKEEDEKNLLRRFGLAE